MENEKRTCLYDKHVALGALISPFGGFVMCSIIPTHACARASSKGCAAGWRILTSARSSCPKLPIDSRFAVGGVGVNTAIQ